MSDVAVIYCRKSQESALPTDVSFDIQTAECEKYAAAKGYRVGPVYRESHSGADLIGRPLIWEAIEDIKQGRANVLLVRNYDRLARKMEHQGVILYEVEEKHGARVEAALEPYDPTDVNQMMMRKMMGVVAEAERMNAVARMERGKQYRAKRGELMGAPHPLYGYAWADDVAGERTRFVEDPESAAIVRRVFSLAMTGHGLRGIMRLLNAEGVPTPSQYAASQGYGGRRAVGTFWQVETVKRIINDRTYMGERTAYRTQTVRLKSGKKTGIVRAIDDAKRVQSQVPALVSLETWNAANAAIAAKETNGRPALDREATWLRLHVYCGVCGSRMHIKRDTTPGAVGKYKYECGKRDVCAGGNFSIRAHLLDPYAYEAMTSWMGAYRMGALRQKMIDRLGLNQVAALVSMTEGYEAQLKGKREELDATRSLARRTRDEVLQAQFLADAEELNAAITKLEAEYHEAREAKDNFSSGIAWVDATLARIKAGMHDVEAPSEDDIRALPYEERRVLLASLGLYLEVFPQGSEQRVKIGYHFLLDPITNEPMRLGPTEIVEDDGYPVSKLSQSKATPLPGLAAGRPRRPAE